MVSSSSKWRKQKRERSTDSSSRSTHLKLWRHQIQTRPKWKPILLTFLGTKSTNFFLFTLVLMGLSWTLTFYEPICWQWHLRVHKHSDGQTLTWHSGKLYGYYGTNSNFAKPKNQPTLCQFLLRKKVVPYHFQCFYPLFITWRDIVPNMRHIDAFFSLF